MRLPLKPPLIALATALLGLILLLATLQYVWLGRISAGERERLQATLAVRASEFAQDFDREVTRAYLLFQTEPLPPDHDPVTRFAERYDRWQSTSAYPRLLNEFHIAARETSGSLALHRFDPASRTLRAVPWPSSMSDWRTRLRDHTERRPAEPGLVIRRLAAPIWETIPALVVPAPMLFVNEGGGARPLSTPAFSYTLLTIDLAYVKGELLPALAHRHLRKAGDANDYHVAVTDRESTGAVIYQSTPAFNPRRAEEGDASAPFFQIRTQDFGALAAEVRRFAFSTTTTREDHSIGIRTGAGGGRGRSQMSVVVQQGSATDSVGRGGIVAPVRALSPSPRWQVVVKHPAGSLEAFVESTRRRNLFVSTSILAVLGASMVLLIVSTRRSQELARQQLEFVAAVSHELRTPLAVIRSAGENLADGVVAEEAQIRKYGELIRAEGRRLSEMVEQILELAGIQSGQRGFARRPVHIAPVIDDVLTASRSLIDEAGMQVDVDIPADLPAVAGDEAALRRVVQNLVGNAIKYGAGGGWMGIQARHEGSHGVVTVRDKGLGIPAAEQARIFEPFYRAPDVIAARIQGAGLGLSLVQRIVDGHGGRIVVKSTPGAGSEFAVFLPVARAEAAESVRTPEPRAETARSS